jgi:hypothetical protein
VQNRIKEKPAFPPAICVFYVSIATLLVLYSSSV